MGEMTCGVCGKRDWVATQIQLEREEEACPECGVAASERLLTADGICWRPGMRLIWRRPLPMDDVVEIEEPRLARWYMGLSFAPSIEHPYGSDPLDHPPLELDTLYAKWTSVFRELLAEVQELLADYDRAREEALRRIEELRKTLAEAERVDAEQGFGEVEVE